MVYTNVTENLFLPFNPCDEAWADLYKLIFPEMDFTWPEFLAVTEISAEHKLWVFGLPLSEIKEQQILAALQHIDAQILAHTPSDELLAQYAYIKPFIESNNWAGMNEETLDSFFEATDNAINHPQCADHVNCLRIFSLVNALRYEDNFMNLINTNTADQDKAGLVTIISNLDWS